jgi:UDP-3-O-[3-hydroxymyristoyl] glucosamine N-acyltransferase
MQFPATQIALIINGRIEGNPDTSVGSFGKIEEAKEGQLTFFANPKYEDFLYSTKASIVILNDGFELKQPVAATLIRVADAYTAFATLLGKYQEIMQQQLSGIQQPSYIASTASYGKNVFIGAFAYLGENVKIGNNTKVFPNAFIGDNVTIGDNCVIHPGVKIYHDCKIGNHVNIHAGTVIGSDGFGFAPQADGSFIKVPQIGNVVIEDTVESGAKLDNLIQIAHNVEVGHSTVIAAQAGVSGSTKIGNGVMIGGQAGIVGHIQLGDGAKVNAQSGVSKSIEAGKAVTGSPAHDYTSALRSQAVTRKLPELERRVKELEALIRQLMSEKV